MISVNNNILGNNFLKFIFFTFPFLLISGPFLPDLFVVFISLYFVVYFFFRNFLLFRNNLIFFFLIFYLYINISSYFAYLPSVSFQTSVPYIRFILFAVFTAYLLKNILDLKKIIFYSFLISYVLLFVDALIQISTGQNILGYPIVNARVASLFRDKLIMGSYVARTLPILIAISYLENLKHGNFIRTFCIILAGTLVYLSAERISSFFYIMTVIVYLFLLPNKKQVFYYIGLSAFVFLILIFSKPSSLERIYKHTVNQMGVGYQFLFSERHEMHFLTAYRMFLDRKFLGHGIKSFRYLCDDPRYTVKEVIINNNKNFSPIDGYVYFLDSNISNDYTKVFLVQKSQNIEFEKKFKIFYDGLKNKDGHDFDEQIRAFELFVTNNAIVNFIVHNEIFNQKKTGSSIKKGDYIYSNSSITNGCNTHPHSSHLQILSELGLIGYLFLFCFLVYLSFLFMQHAISLVFKKKITPENESLYCVFVVLGIVQSLFPVIPSANIFNNWISCLLYFKIAFLFHYLYFYKKL
jgi:hypothetical protein